MSSASARYKEWHTWSNERVKRTAIVTDDVSLLQEEAHVIGELVHLIEDGSLQLGEGKELREADAHEAGHIVTVQIVV